MAYVITSYVVPYECIMLVDWLTQGTRNFSSTDANEQILWKITYANEQTLWKSTYPTGKCLKSVFCQI